MYVCIYMYIYIRCIVNHIILFQNLLCAYVEYVLCADLYLSHVQPLACVMCSLQCVSCAVTNFVASFRACLASLGREGPNKGPKEGLNKIQGKSPTSAQGKGPTTGCVMWGDPGMIDPPTSPQRQICIWDQFGDPLRGPLWLTFRAPTICNRPS